VTWRRIMQLGNGRSPDFVHADQESLNNAKTKARDSSNYRVGQIKWHHFTFLLITNGCMY